MKHNTDFEIKACKETVPTFNKLADLTKKETITSKADLVSNRYTLVIYKAIQRYIALLHSIFSNLSRIIVTS